MSSLLKRFQVSKNNFFSRQKSQTTRRNILSTIFFIVLAFLFLMIFYTIFGSSVSTFFNIFTVLFTKPEYYSAEFVRLFCIFAVAALSFSFAMKSGIFNIGISGQMLAGMTASYAIILALQKTYNPVGGQLLTLFIAVIVSALIAFLTGVLKIYLNVHEVVTCILLNWIILLVCATIIKDSYLDQGAWNSGTLKSLALNESYAFSQHGNYGWVWSLSVTVVCFVVVFVIWKYTVFGHKIKTVGLAWKPAKYYGYKTELIKLSSFAISGVLAGVLGVIIYAGGNDRAINFNGTAVDMIPQEGFNGIAISMIASNSPVGIIFVAILFAIFEIGSTVYFNGPAQDLALGLLMYSVAIYGILDFFKPWLWFKKISYHLHEVNTYKKFINNVEILCVNFDVQKKSNLQKMVLNGLTAKFKDNDKNKFVLFIYEWWLYFTLIFSKKQRMFVRELTNNYVNEYKKEKQNFKFNCITNVVDWWDDKPIKTKNNYRKLKNDLSFVEKTINVNKINLNNETIQKIAVLKKALSPQ